MHHTATNDAPQDTGPTPPCPLPPGTPQRTSSPRVLGVSLFDGVGAFWLALQPFAGTSFEWAEQVSCEVDGASIRVLEHRSPDVKHWGDTSKASTERLNEFVSRVRPDFVLLNGSCPSLQLSRAHAAGNGLDEYSPFWDYVRVADTLRKACIPLDVVLLQIFRQRRSSAEHLAGSHVRGTSVGAAAFPGRGRLQLLFSAPPRVDEFFLPHVPFS